MRTTTLNNFNTKVLFRIGIQSYDPHVWNRPRVFLNDKNGKNVLVFLARAFLQTYLLRTDLDAINSWIVLVSEDPTNASLITVVRREHDLGTFTMDRISVLEYWNCTLVMEHDIKQLCRNTRTVRYAS